MDAYVISAAGFAAMIVGVLMLCAFVIARQQRIIERLTDRMEGRTTIEYRTEGIQEEDASPKPTKGYEPVSWHDYN